MPIVKIALPTTATPLGTLFGISTSLHEVTRFRYSFPSTNSGNATIAVPGSATAACVAAVSGEPGTTSETMQDRLNSVSVSGSASDYVVLEYESRFI